MDGQKNEKDPKQLTQKLAESLEVNVSIKEHLETICSPSNQEITQRSGDLLTDALLTYSHWTSRTGEKSNQRPIDCSKNKRSPFLFSERPSPRYFRLLKIIATSFNSPFQSDRHVWSIFGKRVSSDLAWEPLLLSFLSLFHSMRRNQ